MVLRRVRPRSLDWQAEGLCRQPGVDAELFYPEKGSSARRAKEICAACPVRMECLQYALENNEKFGVWGGLSERERRKLLRNNPGKRSGEAA